MSKLALKRKNTSSHTTVPHGWSRRLRMPKTGKEVRKNEGKDKRQSWLVLATVLRG
jgi:hypothetical protein